MCKKAASSKGATGKQPAGPVPATPKFSPAKLIEKSKTAPPQNVNPAATLRLAMINKTSYPDGTPITEATMTGHSVVIDTPMVPAAVEDKALHKNMLRDLFVENNVMPTASGVLPFFRGSMLTSAQKVGQVANVVNITGGMAVVGNKKHGVEMVTLAQGKFGKPSNIKESTAAEWFLKMYDSTNDPQAKLMVVGADAGARVDGVQKGFVVVLEDESKRDFRPLERMLRAANVTRSRVAFSNSSDEVFMFVIDTVDIAVAEQAMVSVGLPYDIVEFEP